MSEKDDLPFLPTRHGTPTGERNEREMRAQTEADSIRRVQRDHLDGSTTVLHTRGGAFEYVTTKPEPEEPPTEEPLWSFDYFPVKTHESGYIPDTFPFDGKDLWMADGEKGLKGRRVDFTTNNGGTKSLKLMVGKYDGEDKKGTMHGPGFWYGGKNGKDKVTWTRETIIRTDTLYGTKVAVVSVVRYKGHTIKVDQEQIWDNWHHPKVILAACVVRDEAGAVYIRVARGYIDYPAYTWEEQYNSKYGVHVLDFALDGTLVNEVYTHTQTNMLEVDGVRVLAVLSDIKQSAFSPNGLRFITTGLQGYGGSVAPTERLCCILMDISRPVPPAVPSITMHLQPFPDEVKNNGTQRRTEVYENTPATYTTDSADNEVATVFSCSSPPPDPSRFAHNFNHAWSSYHNKDFYCENGADVALVGFSKDNVARVVFVRKEDTHERNVMYDYVYSMVNMASDIEPLDPGSTTCGFFRSDVVITSTEISHADHTIGHFNKVVLAEGETVLLRLSSELTVNYMLVSDTNLYKYNISDHGTSVWTGNEDVTNSTGEYTVVSEFTCIGGDLQDGVVLMHTYGPYAVGAVSTRYKVYEGTGDDYINDPIPLVSDTTTTETKEIPATVEHKLYVNSYPATYDSAVRIEYKDQEYQAALTGAWHPKKKHAVFINDHINKETWGTYYKHSQKTWETIVKGSKEPTATPLPSWYDETPYGEYTITLKLAPCA